MFFLIIFPFAPHSCRHCALVLLSIREQKKKTKEKVAWFFVKEQTVIQSKERKLIYRNCCFSSPSIMACVPQAICFITYLQPSYTHANSMYTCGLSASATKQLYASPTPIVALEGKKTRLNPV